MDSSNEDKKNETHNFFIGNDVLEIVEQFTIWEIYILIILKHLLQIDAYKEDRFPGKKLPSKIKIFFSYLL